MIRLWQADGAQGCVWSGSCRLNRTTGFTPREKGQSLLNNRQAGRRRGRGGQRQQNGGREQGNRIDNRARGNAPQLLEKYKSLARDAQLAGDWVMTEYYLQFADHYFRVVAETRARFEESRPQRDEWAGDEGEDLIAQPLGHAADQELHSAPCSRCPLFCQPRLTGGQRQ